MTQSKKPYTLSRRSLVGSALGAALMQGAGGSAFGKDAPAPARPGALVAKPIPSSGERLPVVGLGTNNYSPSNDAEMADRRAVIGNMPELGATVIDTAPAYRQSEAVLGEIIASLDTRERFFIASKIVARDGDLAGGVAMFEESLRRLRTSRLDLIQVHSLQGVDVLMPMLLARKAEGRVRYVGVTTSENGRHDDMQAVMRKHPLDFIQVDYSLGNRAAANAVLPLAQSKGIAVLVNMPFGGRRDSNMFPTVSGRPLPEWAAEFDAHSWAQVFLKYVVSHPAVTCAIPGMTKLAHLQDNLGAARGRLPDAAQRREIEKFWDRL
jgi:aryl-alcohol dehydrogenase-like predicted oxidoreductase